MIGPAPVQPAPDDAAELMTDSRTGALGLYERVKRSYTRYAKPL